MNSHRDSLWPPDPIFRMPRPSLWKIITSCYFRAIAPAMLPGIDIALGDARLDLALAAMRLDHAEANDWPIVEQLRQIRAFRADWVRELEEKRSWWAQR